MLTSDPITLAAEAVRRLLPANASLVERLKLTMYLEVLWLRVLTAEEDRDRARRQAEKVVPS